MKSTKEAFTLVEIMIVMMIIGLLAAMTIPAFMKVRQSCLIKAYKNGKKLSSEEMEIVRSYFKNNSRTQTPPPETPTATYNVMIPEDELGEIWFEGKKYYVWKKK